MLLYIIKTVISAAIIVAVSEVAKRSSLIGGLIASLPLTSLLAIIWLYTETKDTAKIQSLSLSIFWLVLPSLLFFITLPSFLKKMTFAPAVTLAATVTIIAYYFMISLLKYFNIRF